MEIQSLIDFYLFSLRIWKAVTKQIEIDQAFNFHLFFLRIQKWPKSAKINRVHPFDSRFLDLFFIELWAKRCKYYIFQQNRHLSASNEKFSSIFTFISIFEILWKFLIFRQMWKMSSKNIAKNVLTCCENQKDRNFLCWKYWKISLYRWWFCWKM